MKGFLAKHGVTLLVWGFFILSLSTYIQWGHVVVYAGNAGAFHQDKAASAFILWGLLGVSVVTTIWDVVLTIRRK